MYSQLVAFGLCVFVFLLPSATIASEQDDFLDTKFRVLSEQLNPSEIADLALIQRLIDRGGSNSADALAIRCCFDRRRGKSVEGYAASFEKFAKDL